MIEHAAESSAINISGMYSKADNPPSELIHDDRYPVSSQTYRFTAKEIQTPKAILHVAQESQPGRTAGIRIRFVMNSQDASHNVFIQGNAESQGDLLSNSRTSPCGIPPFGIYDGINKLFGGSMGAGFLRPLLRKKETVFSVSEGVVDAQ